MKKIISILLVVITVFSFTAMMASAEEATGDIKVTFYRDRADAHGTVVYVNYGDDINKVAPKYENQVSGEYIIVHTGWESDHAYYAGQVIELGNIEVIAANSGIKEITFTGVYKDRENNLQNKIEGALEGTGVGDAVSNAGNFFETIINLFKKWIMSLSLFLNAFKPV